LPVDELRALDVEPRGIASSASSSVSLPVGKRQEEYFMRRPRQNWKNSVGHLVVLFVGGTRVSAIGASPQVGDVVLEICALLGLGRLGFARDPLGEEAPDAGADGPSGRTSFSRRVSIMVMSWLGEPLRRLRR